MGYMKRRKQPYEVQAGVPAQHQTGEQRRNGCGCRALPRRHMTAEQRRAADAASAPAAAPAPAPVKAKAKAKAKGGKR